jgi:hypothetical protein
MKNYQFRMVAHELVRSLPPDLIRDLADLDRRGLLDDTLNRALSRVLLGRAAAGALVDFVRTDLVPLLTTTVYSLSQMSNNLAIQGNGVHNVFRVAPHFAPTG